MTNIVMCRQSSRPGPAAWWPVRACSQRRGTFPNTSVRILEGPAAEILGFESAGGGGVDYSTIALGTTRGTGTVAEY